MPSREGNSYSLAATGDDGSTLVVEFFKLADRFAHRIQIVGGERSRVILESIEGGDENWPPSPPLQHVSEMTSDSGERVLLFVGMAGGGHWSLAVETEIVDSRASLVFDVACRTPKPPEWLGSAYRRPPQERDDLQLPLVELGELLADDAAIEIRPTDLPAKFPATVRWRYRIMRPT